jgi:hypothetical protein
MEYISQLVLDQTIEEMKVEVARHLVSVGETQLAEEVNAIISDVLRKVVNKYNI